MNINSFFGLPCLRSGFNNIFDLGVGQRCTMAVVVILPAGLYTLLGRIIGVLNRINNLGTNHLVKCWT